MKTFQDFVTRNRTNQLAREAFTLMIQRGYDPVAFLEWFEDEGAYLTLEDAAARAPAALRPLHEFSLANLAGKGWLWGRKPTPPLKGTTASKDWDEIAPEHMKGDPSAAPGATPGAAPQPGAAARQPGAQPPNPAAEPPTEITDIKHPEMQQVVKNQSWSNAKNKLQALLNQPWIYEKNQQLQGVLTQLMQFLQAPGEAITAPQKQPGMDMSKMSGPMPEKPAAVDPATIAPSAAPVPGATLQPAWHIRGGSPLHEHNKMLINRTVDRLVQVGINPMLFVDWYTTQGILCENAQVFEGRFGDWLSAVGKGLGSMKIFGGEGFGTGYQAHYNKIAANAAGAARQALGDLQHSWPEVGGSQMGSHLKFAIGELDKLVQQYGGQAFQNINKGPGMDMSKLSAGGEQKPGMDMSKLSAPVPGGDQKPAEQPSTPDPNAPYQPTPGAPPQTAVGGRPQWAGDLVNANPEDPNFSQQAMQIFNTLPPEQQQQIDQNARRVWVKKGKPAQDQAGMDQDKARAMFAMAQGHDMSALPTDWFKPLGKNFMEWLTHRQSFSRPRRHPPC